MGPIDGLVIKYRRPEARGACVSHTLGDRRRPAGPRLARGYRNRV